MAVNSVMVDESERSLQDEHREDLVIHQFDKHIIIQIYDMLNFGTEILGRNSAILVDEVVYLQKYIETDQIEIA